MLDAQFIIDNQDQVQAVADAKQVKVDVGQFVELHQQRSQLLQQVEQLRAQRNANAEEIKHQSGKPDQKLIEKGRQLKQQTAELETQLDELSDSYQALWYQIPNIKSDDSPLGDSEQANEVLAQAGQLPEYDFAPLEHDQLGQQLGVIDKQQAALVSGSRFAYLFGDVVKLQFGLLQLGLDVLTSQQQLADIAAEFELEGVSTKPFVPALPPVVVRTDAYQRTARLMPQTDTYKLADDDAWLIGSAEHSLCNYHMDQILNPDDLPLRYVGYSTSFRREAGSYGQDTSGIFRLHHFDKLEMESFTLPDNGPAEHEFMLAIQRHLMQQLGLPYQVVLKCTADMGSPNFRGVDIETWFSGQQAYRETHSADFMTDYQTRRLNTRVELADGSKHYVHTNDATVFAMGRTIAAIMEYYQQADGSIVVPAVLQPYLNKEVISAD